MQITRENFPAAFAALNGYYGGLMRKPTLQQQMDYFVWYSHKFSDQALLDELIDWFKTN